MIANDVGNFSHTPSLRTRPSHDGAGQFEEAWLGEDRIKITLLCDEVPVRRIHLERPPEIIKPCLAL